MAYWVKRILLKNGELVTEHEPRQDENRFEGPVPVVGDQIAVVCRGRAFDARVVWGNWPERNEARSMEVIVPLRVEEI